MAAPPDQVSRLSRATASTNIQADALSAGLSKMSMEDYTSTSSLRQLLQSLINSIPPSTRSVDPRSHDTDSQTLDPQESVSK
jgi:hypothetical protein